MSLYNSTVKTRIIDPVFDRSNFRTEYRLGGTDALYLSNMRLLDMGISVDKATKLMPLTGAFCMKSIQMFDGNKLLDQMQEASIYKTFHNKDDYLTRYCVDCGKKVLEYNSSWDGHRTERGDIIFKEAGYDVFLGGKRCADCHKKIYLKLVDTVVSVYEKSLS